MKTNIKVFTSTGELTTLGRELGKGGEGAVYESPVFLAFRRRKRKSASKISNNFSKNNFIASFFRVKKQSEWSNLIREPIMH